MRGDFKSETLRTIVRRANRQTEAKYPLLVVIFGQELGRTFALDDGYILVGRSDVSDIQIHQESVSRSHMSLAIKGENVVVSDLDSTNGTRINDRSLMDTEEILEDGDLIHIGDTVLKFLDKGTIEHFYHETLFKLANIDPLTQLFNKRYFDDMLAREMSRSQRNGRDLSLIMCDIDHFKEINDGHGHLAGDEVLLRTGHLLRANARREDTVARCGGEEFAIILPETNRNSACDFAEKVRRQIEEMKIDFDGAPISVTVSLGHSSMGTDTPGPKDLCQKADNNLYCAKREGRNRVQG